MLLGVDASLKAVYGRNLAGHATGLSVVANILNFTSSVTADLSRLAFKNAVFAGVFPPVHFVLRLHVRSAKLL